MNPKVSILVKLIFSVLFCARGPLTLEAATVSCPVVGEIQLAIPIDSVDCSTDQLILQDGNSILTVRPSSMLGSVGPGPLLNLAVTTMVKTKHSLLSRGFRVLSEEAGEQRLKGAALTFAQMYLQEGTNRIAWATAIAKLPGGTLELTWIGSNNHFAHITNILTSIKLPAEAPSKSSVKKK